MRDIKYRAWIAEVGQMVFSEEFEKLGDFFNDIYPLKRDRDDLMDFTGLQDSKGVAIYEHDIFKSEDDDDSNGLVIWDKDGWYIQWSKTYKEPFSDYYIEHFEVIGNLYQNPELINQ